jgi:PAN domain
MYGSLSRVVSANVASSAMLAFIGLQALPVSSVLAQSPYRAAIGCSSDKNDALRAETSLVELRCRCFNKCPVVEPRIPPPLIDNRRFTIYEGHDINGNDYRTEKNMNLEGCVKACEGEKQCVAFSFDKWNHWCFLKQVLPTALRLDPQSIVAILSTAKARQSGEPVLIERYGNRQFFDQPFRETRNHCCPVDGGYDFSITRQDKGF